MKACVAWVNTPRMNGCFLAKKVLIIQIHYDSLATHWAPQYKRKNEYSLVSACATPFAAVVASSIPKPSEIYMTNNITIGEQNLPKMIFI